MRKSFLTIATFTAALCITSSSWGQALPTAVARGDLQVGVGWSYVKPDYAQQSIKGITAFGDYGFRPHLGVEAEYHYIALVTPTNLAENSFFIGPRFVLPRNHFDLYAKILAGVGDISFTNQTNSPQAGAGNYFAYAIGAGIDCRITKHIVVRGDYEYQHWSYLTGLTPSAVTVGAAYRFR